MWIHRPLIFATLIAVAIGAGQASAIPLSCVSDVNVGALPYAGVGCFDNDASEQSFLFSVGASGTFDLFTTSWAAGGFAPELTLFNASGSFIASDYGGVYSQDPDFNTCGARQAADVDFSGTTCLDAFITQTLSAGGYRLVLTQHGNHSTGDYSESAFSRFGQPNFTAVDNGQQEGQFLSPNGGFPMANAWDVRISAKSVSAEAPEPAAGILALSGALLVGLLARRHRKPAPARG